MHLTNFLGHLRLIYYTKWYEKLLKLPSDNCVIYRGGSPILHSQFARILRKNREVKQ